MSKVKPVYQTDFCANQCCCLFFYFLVLNSLLRYLGDFEHKGRWAISRLPFALVTNHILVHLHATGAVGRATNYGQYGPFNLAAFVCVHDQFIVVVKLVDL